MKRLALALSLLIAGIAVAQPPQEKPAEEPKFGSSKEKASYAIGLAIGGNLKNQGLDELDLAALAKGLGHALAGDEALLTGEQIGEAINAYQEQVAAQAVEKNKKAETEFLTANKVKPGVKTTASGLQYKVLKSGDGAMPKATDTVRTHYRGTLLNGKKFDSSYDRGEPATFPVTGVIKGWVEALQLMHVGDKWQLFIPAELAYGERGRPGIPPNSTLIFEIELLAIEQ